MTEMDVSLDVLSAKGKRKHDATEMVDGTEQWAGVGFHADYEISTHGRIRNVNKSPPVIIASHINPASGLHTKTFPGDNSWVVARLVLTVFQRERRGNENAIYIDKNCSNLHLSNLMWSSEGNPNRKPATTGTMKKVRVTDEDGENTIYNSSEGVARAIGIHYSIISKYVASGNEWRGYHFEYARDDAVGGCRVRNLADVFDCDKGKIFSDGRIQKPNGDIAKATEGEHIPRKYKRVTIVTNKERDDNKGTGKNNKGTKVDIHRLVAMAFLPPPDFPDAKVDHINGKKWDNRVENLQYVTHRENMHRAHAPGKIEPSHQISVKLYEFDKDTDAYIFKKEYNNMKWAADEIGCTPGNVKKSCVKEKEHLPKARKHAKSAFFKTHVFRFSETDDLA